MKVKWGAIGAGGIAEIRTLPGLIKAENAELIAVMDTNAEHAKRVGDKYQAAAYYTLDDLLNDENVEAVYIATPAALHKEQAIKAAKAKKHLLIEKPLAISVEDGLEVNKLCRQNKVLASAGFMMRFHSCHQLMKEIIARKELGQIVSCRAQFPCWYPDIPGSWRQAFSTSGGGSLMDLGIHCIDLIQYITGSKAKKVSAFTGTKTFQYEVEDSATALLELDNGAYSIVEANFNIPDNASNFRLEFYGTTGSLLAENTIGQVESGYVDIIIDGAHRRYEATPVESSMYTKEIESFCNSILSGSPILIDIEDALQVQRVIESAYESSRTGRHICI